MSDTQNSVAGIPDVAASEVTQEQLNVMPMKDYIETRNEQRYEKEHPETQETEGEGPVKSPKDGTPRWAQKRFDRLTAKSKQAEERAIRAEQRAAELESRLASNGAIARPNADQGYAEPQIETPRTEIPRPEPSTHVRNFEQASRRHPDFHEVLNAAGSIPVSVSVASEISKSQNPSDVIYFLQKNPQLLRAIESEPGTAGERIARLSRDLQGVNGNFDSQASRHEQMMAAHQQRIRPALAALPDKAAVIAGLQVPIAPHVATAILEQENSHDLVIHLARNHPALEQLNQLNPIAAATKLGRIAERLAAKASGPPRERPKPPEPISTVGGSSGRSSVPMDELPVDEYIRIRRAQIRARGGNPNHE